MFSRFSRLSLILSMLLALGFIGKLIYGTQIISIHNLFPEDKPIPAGLATQYDSPEEWREQSRKLREKSAEMFDSGVTSEDPEGSRLRTGVVNAFQDLKYNPCDEERIKTAKKAGGEFYSYLLRRRDEVDTGEYNSEQYIEDGKLYNFSGGYNKDAWEAVSPMIESGLLEKRDMDWAQRGYFHFPNGRYNCAEVNF